jgi:medium-chain acyl-[acyl-carrier-protein] hydrolase
VCPIQLPGRFNRLSDPPRTALDDLVSLLLHELSGFCAELPFAFFGHSMGALIAFELTRALRRVQGPAPQQLFVSARRAPHLTDARTSLYDLPEPGFLLELQRMHGTRPEVFAHPELLRLALPILRADFQLCETYRYRSEAPLDCPVTAFAGRADAISPPALVEAWRRETHASFTLHTCAGDHFYIHGHADWVRREVFTAIEQRARANRSPRATTGPLNVPSGSREGKSA